MSPFKGDVVIVCYFNQSSIIGRMGKHNTRVRFKPPNFHIDATDYIDYISSDKKEMFCGFVVLFGIL